MKSLAQSEHIYADVVELLILFNVAESTDSLTPSDPVPERTGNFLSPISMDSISRYFAHASTMRVMSLSCVS